MGMGDQKQPFRPSYGKVRCDVSGYVFPSTMVRSCPHPNVIAKYGSGGKAYVSVWVCAKCKHAVRFKFHGGIACGFSKD